MSSVFAHLKVVRRNTRRTNGFALVQAGLSGYAIDPRKVLPVSLTESITLISIQDDSRRVREQLRGGDSFEY